MYPGQEDGPEPQPTWEEAIREAATEAARSFSLNGFTGRDSYTPPLGLVDAIAAVLPAVVEQWLKDSAEDEDKQRAADRQSAADYANLPRCPDCGDILPHATTCLAVINVEG